MASMRATPGWLFNAISNLVANAPEVVGFDPIARFVDYIVRAAQGGTRQLAA